MTAPDKIYVAAMKPHEGQDAFVGFAYELNKLAIKSAEYIRKDALLEWAKGREAETRDKAGADDVACAYHDAIMDLIEKIESL